MRYLLVTFLALALAAQAKPENPPPALQLAVTARGTLAERVNATPVPAPSPAPSMPEVVRPDDVRLHFQWFYFGPAYFGPGVGASFRL